MENYFKKSKKNFGTKRSEVTNPVGFKQKNIKRSNLYEKATENYLAKAKVVLIMKGVNCNINGRPSYIVKLIKKHYPKYRNREYRNLTNPSLISSWLSENNLKNIKPIKPKRYKATPWDIKTYTKENLARPFKTKEAYQLAKEEFFRSSDWKAIRYEILRKCMGTCQLCGRSRKDGVILHVDHITPLSKDWTKRLDINNLQVLCEDCNLGKSNTDNINWRKR